MLTDTSSALFERAQRWIPGGVNSPVRAFGSVGGTPRFMQRGDGAHIHDVDGNAYIDLVQSWGPLPLGHGRPEVIEAARSALADGSTFGAPTRNEVELAERIAEAVPSIEKVRLVNSGTEAAMSAARLARGATGRDKLVKFTGHYHGHVDALLAAAGSGVATLAIPGTPGVTPGATQDTLLVDWNDLGGLDAVLDVHGDDVAAILCEPVPANMNLVPADDGFLEALRQRCDRTGALLVFDEVITGFRLGRAGAQGHYGVTPDVTILGKAIGGGFPLAAFGASQAVMDHLAPVGPVYQAGTLSGNPVAVAAGLAQVDLLTDDVYAGLEHTTTRLAAGLRAAFDAADVTAVVRQVGTLAGVLFAPGAPRDFDAVKAADHDRYARFFHAMLSRGVYLAPSGYEVLFVAATHTDEVVDEVVAKAHDAALAIA